MPRKTVDTSKWEEIGEMLTDKAWRELGVGSLLRFNKDGRIIELKIMRMSKKRKRCYVQQIRTYTQAEVDAMAAQNAIGK